MEFIKSIECNTNKFNIDTQLNIHNRAISLISSLSTSLPSTHSNSRLPTLYRICKAFIKNNPDIIFTKADKGNITVALNRNDYVSKITEMLHDTNTYTKIKKDPINKMISDLRKLLTRWKTSGFISHSTYRSLICSDLPKAYGLPKIHKPGYQFRLIVSSIDSPFYSLVSFLHKIIVSKEPYTTSHIENSIQLIEKLKNVKLNDRHVLLSLDVVSLFNNIPLDLAVDSVSKRLDNILEDCKILKNEFIIALKMILSNLPISLSII